MYLARMVQNVKIGPSPDFIQHRLTNAGMRSINNVVDISNYIMLEYGQPLHFFDQAKLGDTLQVRMAQDQEKVVTLDNVARTLQSDDIVITNQQEVVAIAGVMGAKNSDVDEDTTNIIIESAIFNAYNVRYTSIRLNLRSEASIRFEKRLNYEYTKEAIDKACYLLQEYAAGEVLKDTITYDNIDKKPKTATVTKQKINALLGMSLTNKEIEDSFNRLGFTYQNKDDSYLVTIPNRFMDVNIKEDLIEEVGRMVGYDNIIPTVPTMPIKRGKYNDITKSLKDISNRMRSLGLYQTRTYTLISDEESKLFNTNDHEYIHLSLPMSSDKSIIRKNIVPSLLNVANYNLAHQIKDINIYEISTTYYQEKGAYLESNKLAFLVLGSYLKNEWQAINIKYDFFIVKGMVENLLAYLGLTNRYKFLPNETFKDLHPYASSLIVVDNEVIGYFGRVHPNIHKEEIFVCEINLDKLISKKARKLLFNEVSKYPSITKDVAFVLDQDIASEEIGLLIKKTAGSLLTDYYVFDIYSSNSLGDNKKSLAYKLTFNDPNKTLTEDEVMIIFGKIIDEVTKKYKCTIRTN